MNSVPTKEIARPMGAMEKTLSPGRPALWSTPLAMRKAGAPMIVIVVPSEAAKESGISSFDGAIWRSLASVIVVGSITAVVVTWWVKAEKSATEGMMTAMARV